MTELGMTPAARTRVAAQIEEAPEPITIVRLIGVRRDDDGNLVEFDRSREGPNWLHRLPLCSGYGSRLGYGTNAQRR